MHSPGSARAARAALDACFPGAPVRLLIGVLEEKDVSGILAPLVAAAKSVACLAPRSPRALPAERLAFLVRPLARGPVTVEPDAATALNAARAAADRGDVVLVLGSSYLAGEARAAARRLPGFLPPD